MPAPLIITVEEVAEQVELLGRATLPDLQEAFGVHESTARRRADQAASKGLIFVKPGRKGRYGGLRVYMPFKEAR